MLKAAAWRLAKHLHTKPSLLVAADLDTLEQLVDQKCEGKVYGSNRGDALRLVEKIARLRPAASGKP